MSSPISANDRTVAAYYAAKAERARQDAELAASMDNAFDSVHAFVSHYHMELIVGTLLGVAIVVAASLFGIA